MDKNITHKLMRDAQKNKADEFYTTKEVIETELLLYKNQFKNKVVYLPCDKAASEFYKFFVERFEEFGIKRLYASSFNPDGYGELLCYDLEHQNVLKLADDNCDFRNSKTVEQIWELADIIITNPPFSLLRDFIVRCITTEKQFIVLGNGNTMLTKDLFQYIADGSLWWGVSIHSGDRPFRVPDDYPLNTTGSFIDSSGNRFIKVKGVRWFTNIHPDENGLEKANYLKPNKKFSELNPVYFQYMPDIPCIDKTSDIPCDYDGIMGVPLTYYDKHNPELFEIVDGVNRYLVLDKLNINEEAKRNKWHLLTVNNKVKFFRILIRKK